MNDVANFVVRASGVLRYSSPYPADEYTSQYYLCLDGNQFLMMPVRRILTVMVGNKELRTIYALWGPQWKHLGGRRDVDNDLHSAFMDVIFLGSFEEAGYDAKLSEDIRTLRKKNFVLKEPWQSRWFGGDIFSSQWLVCDHDYWAKKIDFHACLRWRG